MRKPNLDFRRIFTNIKKHPYSVTAYAEDEKPKYPIKKLVIFAVIVAIVVILFIFRQ